LHNAFNFKNWHAWRDSTPPVLFVDIGYFPLSLTKRGGQEGVRLQKRTKSPCQYRTPVLSYSLMDTEQPAQALRSSPSALCSLPHAKRKRGGQPGNQNARKHGLYCGTMTADEMCELWDILNAEDIDPEVAVLRIKLISALKHDPGNGRLLRDASKLLAKWSSWRLKLNKADSNRLRKATLVFLEGCLDGLPVAILTERIERTLKT
jgi:hypothetical protein